MNRKSLLIISLLFCFNQNIFAQSYYPEEFADFFNETKKSVQLIIAGQQVGIEINAYASYDSLRVGLDTDAFNSLQKLLQRLDVSDIYIKKILDDLLIGVTSDTECDDKLNSCVLLTADGNVRYVFDFDESVFKIFLPVNAIDTTSDDLNYQSSVNENKALINYASIYAYSDFDGNEQFSLNDKATLGLPVGYLYFDSQYQSSDKKIDFYSSFYDAEYMGNRLQLGYDQYKSGLNSTDYLSSNGSYSGYFIRIGSSSNLIKGSYSSKQKIHFYLPQNGQVEVYRSDRIILSKSFSEGKQFISYEDLPKGSYQATIVIKVAGEVLSSETRQIVNNSDFSLAVNEFDYSFALGILDDDSDLADEYLGNYGSIFLNYRLFENLMLGGGLTSDADSQYFQIGGTYLLGSTGRVEYVGGQFSSNDQFNSLSVAYAPFFLDYQKLELDEDKSDYRLAYSLYGENSTESLGIGINGQFLGGTGYLRYNFNEYSLTDESSSKSISGGWTYKLEKGHLNLSAEYSNNSSLTNNDFKTTMTYRLPLSELISVQSNFQTDSNGFDYNKNYLNLNRNGENWNSSTSLGVSYTRDNEIHSDLSSSLSGSTKSMNMNGYMYLNDQGTSNLSGTLSGSQIISSDGVDFTKEVSPSFLKVNIENKSQNNDPIKLIVKKDGKYNRTRDIRGSEVVRLNQFSDLRVSLDSGVSNVQIEGNKHLDTFSLPGTLYTLESSVVELTSRILILDDIDSNPIEHLSCLGDGCINIEPLTSDGVFRVNYKLGSTYKLVSSKGLCILNEPKNSINHTNGYCLPGLDSEGENNWLSTSKLLKNINDSELMIYLGRFKVGQEIEAIKLRLNENSIVFKSIDVGGNSYIYIEIQQEFTNAQERLLEELDAYVMRRDDEIDMLTINSKFSGDDDV